MITIQESPFNGYFRLNGLDYTKNEYVIRYDNEDATEDKINFSLVSIIDGQKIIASRGYAEVTGVSSWDELFELLNFVGALNNNDVSIQDQTTPIIIASFSKEEAATTLSVLGVINLRTITVTSPTGFAAGKYLSIFSVVDNRFFLGLIISVVGSVVTLDTPLDFAFPVGSFVTCGTRNMNVNGSVTPVIFGVRNTDEQIGSEFDITRIILHCETTAAIDLSKFGDIVGGITNGIVMRKVDGVQRNVFNAKTNGELKSLMYDFDITSAINPAQGQNGFTGRLTFGGQEKLGVVIRLKQGEDLQIVIQDDLSGLELLEIICEGHTVEY